MASCCMLRALQEALVYLSCYGWLLFCTEETLHILLVYSHLIHFSFLCFAELTCLLSFHLCFSQVGWPLMFSSFQCFICVSF